MSKVEHKLGANGPVLNALGFGAMGMSDFYTGKNNDEESLKVLQRAIDLGCTFWDTADIYGDGKNEQLLSHILKTQREKIFLCTKFSLKRDASGKFLPPNGKPEYVIESCENSLKRLGVDTIDLYYQHRPDPNTPIEETVKAMASLVEQGKVRYLGLSECDVATLRRAHAVHPITAYQVEYSPWTLDIETNGLLDACRELGIAVVAYSPLGRGFLTGAIKSPDDFADDDFRKYNPRFKGENFKKNLELVSKIEALASRKGCTAGQLCLAWVLAQGPHFFVIPGTTKAKNLEENVAAAQVKLTPEDLKQVRTIIDSFTVSGERY
ncbi:aldo/keto reductase family protein [Syncephalastrum racemosum]|uniref:Aldo/keto reductase family protein n=1 Tax=Syncephalastrum racemosum TaxID=13706 RepID=A0A1X2HP73_SYNRA|nr:aldo/keto reductase family protein [Syncephalastrum racemosum]